MGICKIRRVDNCQCYDDVERDHPFRKTDAFNEYIWEWFRQSANLKTWASSKKLFQREHREQRRAVTTVGKGTHTVEIQNIYGVPPSPPAEHHKSIESLHKIVQGMQTQSYKLDGLAQANSVITSSNSTAMAQLVQTTVTMNSM